MNNQKFKSSTAFTDLLFLMLCGVTTLFVLSFLLINPISKTEDVPSPAQYLITMEYDKESDDDLDIWIQSPSGKIVYYGSRGNGFINLERDDLGRTSDCITTKNGVSKCIRINREVITLRGTEEGEYKVQMRVYSQKLNSPTGNPVHFEVLGVNPYEVLWTRDLEYEQTNQRISVVRFTVEDGDVVSFSELDFSFDLRRSTPSGGARP